MTGVRMYDQSTNGFEAVRVRPVEARDLATALDFFPGAMIHLRGPDPTGTSHNYSQEFASGRQRAWVAEAEDRLIGMAVLSVESQTLARLTYLHVAGDGPHDAPAARALAEIAIRKAWDAGYLKLVVHTHIPAGHVIEYMHELGFEFARTHSSGSERVVEFYRNLYEPPRDPSSGLETFNEFSTE